MASVRLWRGASAPSAHEEAFVARYDTLLQATLQITGQDRARAEDLVHDAFVQFTLTRPDLVAIQNLDAYLYQTLRHLYLSQVRRAARAPQTSLSLIDYDAIHVGLGALDPQARMVAQDELRRICQYACVRKETSKTGSVLILRFFHGFYPNEIAPLVGGSVRAVAGWLHLARNEARTFVQAPETLQFAGTTVAPPDIETGPLDEFLTNIRRAILLSCRGACPPHAALAKLSNDAPAAAVPCATLAHIVSCVPCLDAICRTNGIPPLSGRRPDDSMGPDRPGPRAVGRGGPTGTPSRAIGTSLHRISSRDVFEHRPKELHVAVNGFVIGSQEVSAEGSAQTVSIHLDEPVAFVEVFSEQGIRLLFMPLDPAPVGAAEQSAHVSLSDDRFVQAVVSFAGAWPSVQVVYRDLERVGASSPLVASASPEAIPTTTSVARDAGTMRWSRRGWQMLVAHPVMATAAVMLALALVLSSGTFVLAAEQVATALWRVAREWIHPSAPRPSSMRRREPIDIPLPLPPAHEAAPAPHVPSKPPLSAAALAGLEVDVLQRLDGVGAFLGEPIGVARTAAGGLRIDGVVDRAERKTELLRALGALVSVPTVHVNIETADEVSDRQAEARSVHTPPAVVRNIEVPKDRTASYDRVREHFLRAAPGADVDARIRAFSQDVLGRSQRALFHSWALRRLAERFSSDALRRVNPDAHAQWQALLHEHAGTVRAEMTGLSTALGDVFGRPTLERGYHPEPVTGTLSTRAAQLVQLATQQDAIIRRVLAVTPTSAAVSIHLDERYWTLVSHATAVAAAIEQITSVRP